MADAPQTGAGKAVCVTGASGYVGSHVTKELLQRGYTVHATVRDVEDEKKYGWVKKLDEGTTGTLKLFSADLLKEGSFDAAVEGCEYVCHVAAVLKLQSKDPKKEIVDPSLEGTRNVLNAILKAKTATRVVVTSSVAAITDDDSERGHTYTETDWHHELSLKNPYAMAKTLAEKYAWKVYEEQKKEAEGKGQGAWFFELVVINPVLVCGPLLHPSSSLSVQAVRELGDGTFPLAPDFYFSIVHVHDVAMAHILSLENEKASGRYIVANEDVQSMVQIAKFIKDAVPHARVPTLTFPNPLLYAVALVHPTLSMDLVRRMAGRVRYFSNKKAKAELGIDFIPSNKAIADCALSLAALHIIPKPEDSTNLLAFPGVRQSK